MHLRSWTPGDYPDQASWSFDLSPGDRAAVIAYAQGGDVADLGDVLASAAQRWTVR